MNAVAFGPENPQRADVAQVLARHHALMRSQSPAESCHVKTGDELIDAGGALFGLRSGGKLMAIGAMVALEPAHFELKSMHVLAQARGKGLGRVLLEGMIARARADGAKRLSLETGSQDEHAAARALYTGAGFTECPPFGDYVVDPLSIFMTRAL